MLGFHDVYSTSRESLLTPFTRHLKIALSPQIPKGFHPPAQGWPDHGGPTLSGPRHRLRWRQRVTNYAPRGPTSKRLRMKFKSAHLRRREAFAVCPRQDFLVRLVVVGEAEVGRVPAQFLAGKTRGLHR